MSILQLLQYNTATISSLWSHKLAKIKLRQEENEELGGEEDIDIAPIKNAFHKSAHLYFICVGPIFFIYFSPNTIVHPYLGLRGMLSSKGFLFTSDSNLQNRG